MFNGMGSAGNLRRLGSQQAPIAPKYHRQFFNQDLLELSNRPQRLDQVIDSGVIFSTWLPPTEKPYGKDTVLDCVSARFCLPR